MNNNMANFVYDTTKKKLFYMLHDYDVSSLVQINWIHSSKTAISKRSIVIGQSFILKSNIHW